MRIRSLRPYIAPARSNDCPGLLNGLMYNQCRKKNSCRFMISDNCPLSVSISSLFNNIYSFFFGEYANKIIVSFMSISLKIMTSACYIS